MKSYIRNTINLLRTKILFPSVIRLRVNTAYATIMYDKEWGDASYFASRLQQVGELRTGIRHKTKSSYLSKYLYNYPLCCCFLKEAIDRLDSVERRKNNKERNRTVVSCLQVTFREEK